MWHYFFHIPYHDVVVKKNIRVELHHIFSFYFIYIYIYNWDAHKKTQQKVVYMTIPMTVWNKAMLVENCVVVNYDQKISFQAGVHTLDPLRPVSKLDSLESEPGDYAIFPAPIFPQMEYMTSLVKVRILSNIFIHKLCSKNCV